MKRIIFGALAVLLSLSASAIAATLNPVQLLNPAASTAGQTIVSTGATTAPGWATVPLTGLSSVAANTVLANATASSAAPAAFSMPSCSTSTSALQWASGSGFACNTGLITAATVSSTYAPLASPALIGTPTAPTAAAGTSTTQIATTAFVTASPMINTPTIVGVTNAGNATAGSVGEEIEATSSAISLTNNATANLTSISLTAGDWDVTGAVYWQLGASSTVAGINAAVTTTSVTMALPPLNLNLVTAFTANSSAVFPVPIRRINVSTTTTVYVVANANITSGTCTATGLIRARRVR